MVEQSCENTLNGIPSCRDTWIEAMSKQGLQCWFDAPSPGGGSTFNAMQAGQVCVMSVDVAAQSVSPMTRNATFPIGDYLFVQVMTSGIKSIEQHGQITTFEAGDMLVVDPSAGYSGAVSDATRMSILRIPKSALRERGLRYGFPLVYHLDRMSPDVETVRQFILYLSGQAGKASESLLARLGDQCLDLMDVLVSGRDATRSGDASVAIGLRAKQMIARHIGDPDLSVARIAASLNISPRSLTRTLKAQGLSPMRYAWSLRLQHAARLLADPRRSDTQIRQIAYECGFADAAHFSRAFKERFGMAPREYAESQRTAPGQA
ncbi:MAG TPA: AraC family transcriptional regulator [Paraburkholderia sp.]